MPLWEIVEAIELVTEIQTESNAANDSQQDIFEALGLD